MKNSLLKALGNCSLGALLLSPSVSCASKISANHLRLTALISKDDGNAAFECWEMATPFNEYPTVGQSITGLASVSNVSYVILPPQSNEGIHKPPHPMYVYDSSTNTPDICSDYLYCIFLTSGLVFLADEE